MFWNNVIVALRNLRKHKLFAIMNVAGLSIGLVIFVFGGLLVEYEREHDAFFEKSDRTYTIGSQASPQLNVGVDKLNTTFSAVGPIVAAELSDVELMSRSIVREYLVTRDDNGFYQNIRFADADFLKIFDLDYIEGDETALESASGVLLTESMAIRYFGRTDVLGEVLSLDNQYDYRVTAVVEDLPRNTHLGFRQLIGVSLVVSPPPQHVPDEEDRVVGRQEDQIQPEARVSGHRRSVAEQPQKV